MFKLSGTIYKYKQIPLNIKWEIITVYLNYDALYKVYYTEFKNRKLIKPYCKYYEAEFQHLFDFKAHCSNYDSKRIIDITDACKS